MKLETLICNKIHRPTVAIRVRATDRRLPIPPIVKFVIDPRHWWNRSPSADNHIKWTVPPKNEKILKKKNVCF